jgi:hypothetical protein
LCHRRYLGLSNTNILLDTITCLELLSKDVYESGQLEESFVNQETDIAIMDVSHSQFGDLFTAYLYGLDNLSKFEVIRSI